MACIILFINAKNNLYKLREKKLNKQIFLASFLSYGKPLAAPSQEPKIEEEP
jgi:hypothetical protein